jgi:hypothetical protein
VLAHLGHEHLRRIAVAARQEVLDLAAGQVADHGVARAAGFVAGLAQRDEHLGLAPVGRQALRQAAGDVLEHLGLSFGGALGGGAQGQGGEDSEEQGPFHGRSFAHSRRAGGALRRGLQELLEA